VDVSAALLVPGVVDVVTCKDIPGKKVRTLLGYDEELLADKEVLSYLSVSLPGKWYNYTTVFSIARCILLILSTMNAGKLLLCNVMWCNQLTFLQCRVIFR